MGDETSNDESDSSQNDRTYVCPSPDDCSFKTTEVSKLSDHVNSEHSGEYTRPEWPDPTPPETDE